MEKWYGQRETARGGTLVREAKKNKRGKTDASRI